MAAPENTDRSTCCIRNWRVFAPGLYKATGEYFSPEDVRKVGRNFAEYSAVPARGVNHARAMRPLIKIGHDRFKRYTQSLGFPSLGEIVRAHTEPDGVFVVDEAVGIPRIVGSAINSGFLKSGSAEFPPKGAWRPPADPNAHIDGDVLSGVALLGEELPAVPGFEPPKAVFADGTPVPPLTDAEQIWWLGKMSEIANSPGAHSEAGKAPQQDADSTYTARSLCFSALNYSSEAPPVDPQAIIAALQAMPPEQQQQIIAAIQAPPPGGGAPPPPAAEGAPPPAEGMPPPAEEKPPQFSAEAFAAFAADCKKRFGALEALESAKKEKEEKKEGMEMSAMVDRRFAEVKAEQRHDPKILPSKKKFALSILTDKTFASDSDRMGAFNAFMTEIAEKPVNPLLRDVARDGGGKKTGLTPLQVSMLNSESMKRSRHSDLGTVLSPATK